MIEAYLGWFLGSLMGAATDPIVFVYALAVAVLASNAKQMALASVVGGAFVSLGISAMTFSFGQAVSPGITFAGWAGRTLVFRVLAVLLTAGIGFAVGAAIRKRRARAA